MFYEISENVRNNDDWTVMNLMWSRFVWSERGKWKCTYVSRIYYYNNASRIIIIIINRIHVYDIIDEYDSRYNKIYFHDITWGIMYLCTYNNTIIP